MRIALVGKATFAEASLYQLGRGVKEPTRAWGLALQRGLERTSDPEASATSPQPNAWFRSAIRSSGSSIPTETRMSPGVIPSRNRSSSGMSEWVIAAGCEARVSVPPRLTASLITLSRSRTAKASASPPLTSKLKVEPGLLHWRSNIGRSGWPSGKYPRYQTDATLG